MQYKIIVDKQPSTNPSAEKKEYIIDIEELRVKGDVYDSLNIELDRTYVTRRLSLSEYGVLSVLDEPVVEELTDIDIKLFEGDNYIYLLDKQGNKFYAEYIVKNDFTDLYVTTNQMNSAITQTAESIEFSVNQKLEGYSTTEEMNAAINIKAGEITSSVSKTYSTKEELNTAKSEIKQTTDSITSTVSTKVGKTEVISSINQSAEAVQINANKISLKGKNINLTGDNTTISSTNFNVDKNGNMMCNNGIFNGGKVDLIGGTKENSFFNIYKDSNKSNINRFYATNDRFGVIDGASQRAITGEATADGTTLFIGADENNYIASTVFGSGFDFASTNWHTSDSRTQVDAYQITTPKLTQTSLAEQKKNFEKMQDNAIDIIKQIDIYKYNLKSEKDTDKKHIGFIIGEGYNYSKEVTSIENDGVDNYSFTSLCCKAIQELQKMIEQLQKEIKEVQHE